MHNHNQLIKYCSKCGDTQWTESKTCRVCKSLLKESDAKYELYINAYMQGKSIKTGNTFEENEQRLFEEVIKPNPEFDPDLYARKDEIIKQKQEQEMNEFRKQTGGASWVDDKIGYKPKCPMCGSSNIEKISVGSKIVGAGLFGIFSKTARNQFKCNNCGYKW